MQRYISNFGRFLLTEVKQCHVVKSSTFYGSNNFRHFSQVAGKSKVYSLSRRKVQDLNDLFNYINNGKVFYLKQLTNILPTIDFENVKSEDALLLLKCCGSVVPDSSLEQRNRICQEIFSGLQKVNKTNTGIFNRYIKTCTENRILISTKEFMLKCEPNNDTYKLLLENFCQFGNIEDAFGILEIMKNKGISLGSDSVNNLILAHTLSGGLKSAALVLNTIRTAQISENNSAKFAIFKGIIRRGILEEFQMAVKDYPIHLTDHELIDLIEELGLKGLESWLTEVYSFYKPLIITRDIQNRIEKVCIHLIHMGQPKSAMHFYETFIEPHSDVAFGFNILKEMLHCNIDIEVVISLAKALVEKELNPYILENLTELALKFKYEEQAWTLLKSLQTVKLHYFWPLFVQCGRKRKENGIFSTLKRTKEFDVKFDAETLEYYIIPYCDLSDIKSLMLKLQEVGFNVREILSPLLITLLKQKKPRKAAELCRLYNVNISGENFVQLLARSWAFRRDSTSALVLLTRYCESNKLNQDFVGTFLIDTATSCELKIYFCEYLELIKLISENRLRMSAHSADIIKEICKPFINSDSQRELESALHTLVDLKLDTYEDVSVPHPKNMDLEGLESHLIELREKNMETRGVLRRLIQIHASKGNVQRVKDLRQEFLNSGYEESPGIKSSIMYSYVIGGELEEAMNLYGELKTLHPEFSLDSFKFIDLAKLLIDNDRFEEGYYILQDEVSRGNKVGKTRPIGRNCRNLLNACNSADQVAKIFELLTQNGLCEVSNVMLGPLIKVHLKSGDIDEAVERYVELSKKYKCTPLQLELLCAVAKRENRNQLEQVLKATEQVHGHASAQLGLIAALAENGQENALKKTLIQFDSPIQELVQNRCKRWVEERKIEPLKCLASACIRLPPKILDVLFVYKCILHIYDLNGDIQGAASFFDSLPEEARSIELEKELHKIYDKSNVSVTNVKLRNTF